jgi:hypothetical protein
MDSVKYSRHNPKHVAEAYAHADKQTAEFGAAEVALSSSIEAMRAALRVLIKERERVGLAKGRMHAAVFHERCSVQNITE